MADGALAAPRPPDSEDASSSPRLLIVDDIADNRAVLGRRFERRGYDVAYAEGGLPALEMIRTGTFDLVLLDWMMGDLEGIEVLRRVRADRSAVSLPVIMATAKTQSEDVVQALAAGANDYITKPIDFSVALARVETQIGRKRAEEQLQAANAALARANWDLERRIAERTAELSAANARLHGLVTQAEAANRAKDEFLSTVSHELRTPLNGVIGMTQMLATTGLTEVQREMVGVIAASGDSLREVVSNLLEVVDLGAGSIVLSPQAVGLAELVGRAAETAQTASRNKGLSFEVVIAPDARGQVHADPVRLRQILAHLLDNAVKFTDDGGVRLTVRRDPAARENLVFEVVDTGVGFDPAITERLFQRFQQADGSLTRAHGGVGLGLAICRELVTRMGGTIDAESRPGAGSTFRVELPLPPI